MANNSWLINIVGWTGASASLAAYSLNSQQIISSSSTAYLLLNLVGCALLIVYTYKKRAYANATLNSIWLFMTLLAIGSTLYS